NEIAPTSSGSATPITITATTARTRLPQSRSVMAATYAPAPTNSACPNDNSPVRPNSTSYDSAIPAVTSIIASSRVEPGQLTAPGSTPGTENCIHGRNISTASSAAGISAPGRNIHAQV